MRSLRAASIFLPALLCACAGVTREGILKEQDLRVSDSALLKRAASSKSPEIRSQAFLAMGRIQSAAYLKPLLNGLSDPEVAEQAAFSLGQLGLAEPALSSTTLLTAAAALERFAAAVQGPQRLAAIEALGKTGGPQESAFLVDELRYPEGGIIDGLSSQIRGQAALALFRQRLLNRVPEYSSATVEGLTGLVSDPDPEVRWRAVYAFSRFSEPRAAEALSNAAADPDATVRFFACRALGLLKTLAPTVSLVKAAADPDYLVRTEAVRALGLAGRADLLPKKVFTDPSPHVRAAAADAVAAANDREFANALIHLAADGSPLVAGQALAAWPKVRPRWALPYLKKRAAAGDWWVRSRAYAALAEVPGSGDFLRDGLNDKDPNVAAAALEALAKSSSTEVEAVLDMVLRDPAASLELVGAAAEAAGHRQSLALLEALRTAYEGELARDFPELADDLKEAYAQTLSVHPEHKALGLPERPKKALAPSAFIGAPPPASATVILQTDKGDIELSLAVEEAPIHSATFIENVRKGFYNGTTWHRVVSGFVVQGGDPRGSGWGDGGVSLRDEINRLPFTRGTVGMPKAGKDTGGCQLFFTHVPTPHLDGRYTVFGKVVSGMDAVDRLEPGDRIVRAYLK